jgi:diguanylate cyclase
MSFFGRFYSLSLKTKITATVLLLFLASIWVLTFFISMRMEADMTAQIEAQQLSTASYIANSIDSQVKMRLAYLTSMAELITPDLVANPDKLKDLVRDKIVMPHIFQVGCSVISKEGRVIADYPRLPGRTGVIVSDREYFRDVIATGEPAIGKPQRGRITKKPVIAFAVPVLDHSGKLIAVLAGYTLLSDPTLLGTIEDSLSVRNPSVILVISLKYRIFITSNNPELIMARAPEPGVNVLLDRFMAGYEGSGVTVTSRGIEVFAAAKRIPSTDWLVRIGLPTELAFAPINRMKMWVYSIALGLSFLSSLLVWFVIRKTLRPLDEASKLIEDITEQRAPSMNIPVVYDDEVGKLIISFNKHLDYRRQAEAKLHELSVTDGLTGLANRRSFDQSLDEEWRRALRNGYQISLMMIDVDYFKLYNDAYGHLMGDECLVRIADILKPFVRRAGDIAARFGGEEFAVVLSMADRQMSVDFAEMIRRDVEALKIPHEKSEVNDYVTVSIGVVSVMLRMDMSQNGLVNTADKALYQAKKEGRNRVVFIG